MHLSSKSPTRLFPLFVWRLKWTKMLTILSFLRRKSAEAHIVGQRKMKDRQWALTNGEFNLQDKNSAQSVGNEREISLNETAYDDILEYTMEGQNWLIEKESKSEDEVCIITRIYMYVVFCFFIYNLFVGFIA